MENFHITQMTLQVSQFQVPTNALGSGACRSLGTRSSLNLHCSFEVSTSVIAGASQDVCWHAASIFTQKIASLLNDYFARVRVSDGKVNLLLSSNSSSTFLPQQK